MSEWIIDDSDFYKKADERAKKEEEFLKKLFEETDG